MIDEPSSTEQDTPPDLPDRLLAALLAPIFFNLSMLIIIAVLFLHHRRFSDFWFSYWPPGTLLRVTLMLPVAAGFLSGTRRFTTLLGHLFYTHQEHEQDLLKTLAAWAAFIGLAWLLS